MNYWIHIAGIAVLLVFQGCAGARHRVSRAAVPGAGAVAGAAAGWVLGDGNAAAVAGGAVGGAILGAALQGDDPQAVARGYEVGRVHGQSDAIKRHYWLRQDLERQRAAPPEGERVFYTVPGPPETEDGRLLAPHLVVVPVIE